MSFPAGWTGGPAASNANLGFGYGQTPALYTSTRALGTTYYNTTGKPITVYVQSSSGGVFTFALSIAGVSVWSEEVTNVNISGTMIVPPGMSYSATGGSLITWAEVR